MKGAFVGAFLIAAALLAPMRALAQTSDPAALVREGADLRRQGRDDEALERFRRAYEIGHRPIALAQMGLAEQALGRWLVAEAHLRTALAIRDDGWITRNRAALEQAYAVIEQHVGRVDVRGSPAGAEVYVDGERAGSIPMSEPQPHLVGNATVEVRAPGHVSETRTVPIAAGQLSREEFALRPEPPPVASSSPEPVASSPPEPSRAPPTTASAPPTIVAMPRSTQPPSRVPVVLSAVGAAVFLGLGVGLHAYWQLAAHDYNTQCAPDSATPSCSDERTRGTLAAGFAFGSYAVAAALAVTTIVLLARPGAPPRETARAGAFSCAPGLGAAVCTVTF